MPTNRWHPPLKLPQPLPHVGANITSTWRGLKDGGRKVLCTCHPNCPINDRDQGVDCIDTRSEYNPDFDSDNEVNCWDWTGGHDAEDALLLYNVGEGGKYVWRDSVSSYVGDTTNKIYDRCTAKELRGFVQARRLPDPCPGGWTLKYYYIRALEKADTTPAFPLMRLPPEMRVMVFVELLAMRPGEFSCYPEILRASKQINREARDVLFAENQIRCVLAGHDSNTQTHILHRKPLTHTPSSFFRRLQHLHISIKGPILVTLPAKKVKWKLLNIALEKMIMLMVDEHNLKSLTVEVCKGVAQEESEKARVLFALQRLRGIAVVNIVGDIEMTTAKPILEAIQSNRPTVNVYKISRLLKAEYDNLNKLKIALDAYHEPDYCECGECLIGPTAMKTAKIRDCWELLHESLYDDETRGTAEGERRVMGRLEDLQNVLGSINKLRLRAAFDAYAKSVEVRTVYGLKHRLDQPLSTGIDGTESEDPDWSAMAQLM